MAFLSAFQGLLDVQERSVHCWGEMHVLFEGINKEMSVS